MLSTKQEPSRNEPQSNDESEEVLDEGKDNLGSVTEVRKAKSKEKKLSTFGFELWVRKESNSLTIQSRDALSKRLFGATYTHKELTECGFHPRQSLLQIVEIIENAINQTNSAVVAKLSIGYTNGNESNLHEEYRSGDKMYVSIEHDVALFQLSYGLLLNEIKQSEVNILHELVKDLRSENQQLSEELTTIKEKLGKFEEEQKENQKLSEELATIKEKLEELEFEEPEENKENSRKLEIGHWNSSTNDSNYRVWNVCILNTTTDLFDLQTSGRDVVVKKAGIYRIQANVTTCQQTSQYAYLEIGGSAVSTGHSYTSATTYYQHIALNHVAKLTINTVIRVVTVGHYDSAANNTLTVERLGDCEEEKEEEEEE